jgi:hypothetical protein
LSGTITGHQNTDLFIRDPAFTGMTTPFARFAAQVPFAFVRFEQVGFIGFGNAVKRGRTILTDPIQETMPPTETGITMDARVGSGLADRQGLRHRIEVAQAFRLITKTRQGRTRERIKGFPALLASITLQASNYTVTIPVGFGTKWTRAVGIKASFY